MIAPNSLARYREGVQGEEKAGDKENRREAKQEMIVKKIFKYGRLRGGI